MDSFPAKIAIRRFLIWNLPTRLLLLISLQLLCFVIEIIFNFLFFAIFFNFANSLLFSSEII